MVMGAARRLSLKERQRLVIEKSLLPCADVKYQINSKTSDHPPWQVLIVDAPAQEILCALFSLRDLRRLGVTLQLGIDRPRDPVPDVLATYIVAPTPENVAWLLKDVQNRNLYRRVTVAFTSTVSRQLLAAIAAQITAPSPIVRVLDLHASFVSLEQNLFSLAMPRSYAACKQICGDDDMHTFTEPVVAGLLSVFMTLGLVPIIRAQAGGPAAVIAKRLNDRIRASLDLFRSDFTASIATFRRPLLLLMDRDIDLAVMLHHSWTYQALIHDCLEMSLNTIVVPPSGTTPGLKYEADKRQDAFWAKNAGSPFPEVAQAIEEALVQYRNDVETINRGAQDKKNPEAPGPSTSVSTSALASAVASLPELAERKQCIDIHTNIATAVLDEINKRTLDTFYELEGEIMDNAHTPASSTSAREYNAAVLELLKGVRKTPSGDQRGEGTPNDRLRLFLIFYLVFGAQLTENDMIEFQTVLSHANVGLGAVEYARQMCGYRHEHVRSSSGSQATVGSSGSKRELLSGLMTSVMSRGYRGIASVAQNAKKMIADKRRTLACARVLTVFMDERSRALNSASADDILGSYLMFDPKLQADSDSVTEERMRRMVFTDAVLFVVGGGNYVEYEDCLSAIQSNSGSGERRNLLYGTTQLLNPEQFMKQLEFSSSE
jgi:sec1 family domain-containing protein 1